MTKTVLITGATGAIGKATALELAKNNCRVILMGRNEARLKEVQSAILQVTGNKEVEYVVADLSEPAAVRAASAQIKSKHAALHALVHTAAIYKKQRLENSQGLEYMFATNHLGPFLLTRELTDLLKAGKPARVVTVSAPSFTKINFDDLQGKQKFSAGFLGAFGATKMMNLMFTYALARRLEGSGVTCSVFHPGLVKTELTREMPALMHFIFKSISGKPDKPARMLCALAIDPAYASSNGTFLGASGKPVKSNAYSHEVQLQEKLWALSEDLCK